MNHNLKYGLTLGLINVVFSLALLLIDYQLMVSTWVGIVPLAISIVVLLIAGFELRKLYGGYLPFRDAFVSTLIIIAISGAVTLVYNILVFNVFSPETATLLHEKVIDQTARWMESFGVEDDVIDQTIMEMEANNPYSVGNLLLSYIYTLVGGVILALIIGVIVKKKKPELE